QTKDTAIHPTPIIGMVGLFSSLEDITPNHFQASGDLIYLIGETANEFGGSELQNLIKGRYEGKPPVIDLALEAKRQEQLLEAIQAKVVQSAEDISIGGLAIQLVKSIFPQGLGAKIVTAHEQPTALLFSETQSRYLI